MPPQTKSLPPPPTLTNNTKKSDSDSWLFAGMCAYARKNRRRFGVKKKLAQRWLFGFFSSSSRKNTLFPGPPLPQPLCLDFKTKIRIHIIMSPKHMKKKKTAVRRKAAQLPSSPLPLPLRHRVAFLRPRADLDPGPEAQERRHRQHPAAHQRGRARGPVAAAAAFGRRRAPPTATDTPQLDLAAAFQGRLVRGAGKANLFGCGWAARHVGESCVEQERRGVSVVCLFLPKMLSHAA